MAKSSSSTSGTAAFEINPYEYNDMALFPLSAIAHKNYLALKQSDKTFLVRHGFPRLLDWFSGEYMQHEERKPLPTKDLLRAFALTEQITGPSTNPKKLYRLVSIKAKRKKANELIKSKMIIPALTPLSSWTALKECAIDIFEEIYMSGVGKEDEVHLILSVPFKDLSHAVVGSQDSSAIAMRAAFEAGDIDGDAFVDIYTTSDQAESVLHLPKKAMAINNIILLKMPIS